MLRSCFKYFIQLREGAKKHCLLAQHSILIANHHIIIADAESVYIISQQAIDSCDGHHFIGSRVIRKQAVFCQAINETIVGTNHTSDLIIRVKI